MSPEEAALFVAKEYTFDKELLKHEGIDPKTGFHIINLSPDSKPEIIDGVRKDNVYVDPVNSTIINPYKELLEKKLRNE